MKIGSCLYHNQTFVFIEQEGLLLLPALDNAFNTPVWHDLLQLIQQDIDPKQAIEKRSAVMEVRADQITLLPPIPRPNKNIMCLGLNYLDHAEETAEHVGRSAKKPQHPIVFTKAAHSVTAHETRIPFDLETCSQLDWEVELGVIIGKTGRKITHENALDHVFGYTIINDLSARDLQFNHKQFFLGKSIEGGCPIGPHIVTADTIPNPQNLSIECRVNDVSKQSSNTQYMIFSVADIIVTLSRGISLEAGDIIATGTPSGVGFVREPAEFLKPGDCVECEVEHIGVLRNYL